MSDHLLGMPTLIELPDLEANVALARELGLGFVELNMNVPGCSPALLPAERLRALGEQSGLAFTLHLPEDVDLASFHRRIRAGHLACCTEAVCWAADAGVTLVNLHLNSGIYFTLPERRVWLYDVHRETFLGNLAASFDELLAVADACDVAVCIENTGDFGRPFIGKAIERLLSRHGERLCLTWDLGHDAGSLWTDRPTFERHRKRIGHMHLHDFDGRSSHQRLFSGEVDIEAALRLARDLKVATVIEVKTPAALTESVRELDKRGLRP